MADIDLKTLTPDTSLPTTGFLFGADSQASASPSVYSTQTVATTLLGSTSLTGATITTSQPVLDLAQTWNAGAVTFTGLKFNATDTASAVNSELLSIQNTGGVTNGGIIIRKGYDWGSGTIVTPILSAGSGLLSVGATNSPLLFGASSAGNSHASISNSEFQMRTGMRLGFTSGGQPGTGVIDAIITRRAVANLRLGAADVGATTSTVTITIAAPGVVTWTGHGFSTGTPVVFTTTGALPTGITAGTTYYAVVVDANTFQIASSVANAIAATPTVITTSGTQSGTHTGTRYNITQRLGMQSNTGVTDRLGADLVIQGSQGTGTGTGGSIIFQVAPAGSTGTAQNALVDAAIISSDGRLTLSRAAAQLRFSLDSTFISGNDSTIINISNKLYVRQNTNSVFMPSDVSLSWSSSTSPSNVGDTVLVRDASNTLALRNGTNPQTFRSYRSFTDASNYSRLAMAWNTSTALVMAEGAGTGSDGSVAFNDAALATNATVGFVMIPSCAGAPTGTPADIPTGQIPMVWDSTNLKLYVYTGGAWKSSAAFT